MLDLALGASIGTSSTMFLVAPDDRRDDVMRQLARPAFSRLAELGIREAIVRNGSGLKPVLDISQRLGQRSESAAHSYRMR